jgi:hypothetical protein
MLPSRIVRLDALPLTPNGKIDRQQLPKPDWIVAASTEREHQLKTSLEQRVADIWAALLRVKQVGLHDNFLQLGGDSLLALRVIVRVNQEFKLGLPISTLLQNSTLARFAAVIDDACKAGLEMARAPIARISDNGPQPLSFFQERILKYASQARDPQLFATMVFFDLDGPINVRALERALNELVERHAVLRTVFRVVDGQPAQIVQPFESMELSLLDLSCKTNRSDEIKRVSQNEADRQFDLSRGPLFRFRIVRLANQLHVLMLSFHHLVYDASVRWVLFKELEQLYAAYSQDLPNPLSAPAPQYVDFAIWQRQRLDKSSAVYQCHAKYWTARLVPASQPIRFPFCWAKRPEIDIEPNFVHGRVLPTRVYDRLEVLGQARGVTQFMILFAGLNAWLWRLTGSTDILVGTNVNQLDLPEMQGVVGPTSNLLALRTNLSGNPTFLELLDHVRQDTIEAFAHQEMPFEEVVAALASSGCASPTIQTIFQLVKVDTPLIQLPGVRVDLRDVPRTFWGLMINWIAEERRLRPIVCFDSSLYDPLVVRLALPGYCNLLARVAENPERRLSEYFKSDEP